MVKESLRPCEFGLPDWTRFPGLAGAFGTKTRAGAGRKIQVAEADGAGFGAPDRRRLFSQGPGRARTGVFAIAHAAPVMDALRLRLRAIREHVPQLGKLRIAVPFHELGDARCSGHAGREVRTRSTASTRKSEVRGRGLSRLARRGSWRGRMAAEPVRLLTACFGAELGVGSHRRKG